MCVRARAHACVGMYVSCKDSCPCGAHHLILPLCSSIIITLSRLDDFQLDQLIDQVSVVSIATSKQSCTSLLARSDRGGDSEIELWPENLPTEVDKEDSILLRDHG